MTPDGRYRYLGTCTDGDQTGLETIPTKYSTNRGENRAAPQLSRAPHRSDNATKAGIHNENKRPIRHTFACPIGRPIGGPEGVWVHDIGHR